jgi:TolB-like protein
MRGGFLGFAAMLLGFVSSSANAGPGNIAMGTIEERGRGVRGHAQVLKQALGYELSRGSGFTLVADKTAKRAVVKRIHKTNRHSIDESSWIQIGKAVGATHLLLGEVRQDRNSCSAFVQLVHLETRKTRVTRPEYYDCTRHDLVELAGDLSEELTGKRATAAAKRQHRRPRQPPIKITMRGHEAEVDGVPYTLYAAAPDSDSAEKLHPDAVPFPPIAPEYELRHTQKAPPPAFAEAHEYLDLERWPALQPHTADDGSPVFNLYELGRFLSRQSALTASAIMGWPILFVFVGALLQRAKKSLATTWLRVGLNISILCATSAVAVYLLYRYGLQRAVTEDMDLFLLGAPAAALVMWAVGMRIFVLQSDLRIFRQFMWAGCLTATQCILLLVGTQMQLPVLYLVAVLLVLWLGLRVLTKMRKVSP